MPAVCADDNLTTAGTAAIVVARGQRQSRVTRVFASSPLKILTPHTRGGGAAWVFTSSYGGGLVDGDALDIHISVERAATLLFSTQSSTKVYRSPHGTSVTVRASIAEDATLVSLPDPVMPFAGASYRQVQHFDLHDRGNVVALDWMTAGRLARGERWEFEEYASTTIVQVAGARLVHDAQRLSQADGDLAERLGCYDVLAMLIIVGPEMHDHVEAVMNQAPAAGTGRPARVLISAASIDGGCLVRLAGTTLEDVRQRVRFLLSFVPAVVGDDPWARKW